MAKISKIEMLKEIGFSDEDIAKVMFAQKEYIRRWRAEKERKERKNAEKRSLNV